MQITPTQDDVITALRNVLIAALPSGTDVILGQANRVPEPSSVNFVVMTPTRRSRLRTNSDDFDDCKFIGSISATTLTAQAPDYGTITPGRPLWGTGVSSGTTIVAQLTGTPGGAGTYSVTPSQTVALELMACGALQIEGGYELVVQLDFHGDGASSQPADNAQLVSTLFHDPWATDQFSALRNDVVPLHADEPKQIPFYNGEELIEDRWIVEVHLQVNETVAVPQQFMDTAVVGVINVDAAYPPT